MLLAQDLVPQIQNFFDLTYHVNTMLFRNSVSNQRKSLGYIDLDRSKVPLYLIKTGLAIAVIVILIAQFLYAIKYYPHLATVATIIPSLQYIISRITHIPQVLAFFHRRSQLVDIHNAFLDFERRHNSK